MNDVDEWFAARRPAAADALQRVREIILAADPRMTEYVKYGNVQFDYGGGMASFVQSDKKTVSLMFHRGGKIVGTFPHMEGTGRQVRFMRFANAAQVEERAEELTDVVRAWCAFAERGGGAR